MRKLSMNSTEFGKLSERFESFLRNNGLKPTIERKAIFEEVVSTDGLFEADDLLAILKRKKIKTSRATIYRVLELLCRAGVIRKVCAREAHVHFQKISDRPRLERMICLKCGATNEFFVTGLSEIHHNICRQFNFRMTDYCFQLFGFCEQCAGEQDEQ